MSKIEETKRLAKETLMGKWYPISEGEDIKPTKKCSFCYDAMMKEYDNDENDGYCVCCLIYQYGCICENINVAMTGEGIENIVHLLEILTKDGKLDQEEK